MDQFQFHVYFPLVTVTGEYTIEGNMIETPIKKRYLISGEFNDFKADIIVYGDFFWGQKDGDKYFRVNHVSTELYVGGVLMNMKDVVKNQTLPYYRVYYAKRIWKAQGSGYLLQKIERRASNVILDVANKIYLKFPISVLMPVFV